MASALFVLGTPASALADEPAEHSENAKPARETQPNVELRHDLKIDIPVTAALGAGLIVWTAALRGKVTPGSCHICDGAGASDVNAIDRGVRDWLRQDDSTPPSTTSHVFAYGIAPVTTAGLLLLASNEEGHLRENWLVDLVLMAEAVFSSQAVNETIKTIAARERPNIHAIEDPVQRRQELNDASAITSFPSGHTASVFAMTAAAGTIASMRKYRLAPVIWVAGSILGVATAYLRIAADQHYFTDTLAGAGVGVLVGGGVPLLFHRPRDASRPEASSWLDRATLTTQPVAGGRTVNFAVSF